MVTNPQRLCSFCFCSVSMKLAVLFLLLKKKKKKKNIYESLDGKILFFFKNKHTQKQTFIDMQRSSENRISLLRDS